MLLKKVIYMCIYFEITLPATEMWQLSSCWPAQDRADTVPKQNDKEVKGGRTRPPKVRFEASVSGY